ncbi:(2Fe-2S)-binding protein [Aromatoleum petrolei]|uniref:2Fe-2S iron-sulfur cluster binding domain-containing protein n=1 Tax=Aromatoleum petrolei TaxID=76116 RepID=A0ABX1MNP1_9RHOO|nr:(2Fe-2S)-binding protein [Aromatoleum petrolei]NMF89403.1 2Fe-2S iron-sulfur cluster binding domain-containing protein [Aromatoleum petrolei]QTQ39135.1 [2Fe-2S] iron-sulfur domain-containing protein [Aromatoleum petrolei]
MLLTHDIEFTLNGVTKKLTIDVTMNALDMLRDVVGLTGTKYGCGEGECGACTIRVDGETRNSCLMFAVDFDGRDIVTIEGLAADPKADALRESFVEHGAVQCGFCTPGMVMQASHILDTHPDADAATIKRGLEGNLCRCTGYKKIVDAVESACCGGR